MSTKPKKRHAASRHGYTRKTDDREGQQVVKYIEKKDYDEMVRLCRLHMESAQKGSKTYYKWHRNYMILLIGVNTGLRINTLLESTARDFAGGKVTVTEQKTGKRMQYELNDQVNRYLKEYISEWKIKNNGYLFQSQRDAKPNDTYTSKACWSMIKQLAKEAGIEYPVGCHSLRKSYARWYYDETKDLLMVQKLLMHESAQTTLTYIGLEDSNIAEVRSAISNISKYQ